MAGDGQSLRSIMQGGQKADQSFVSVVSLYFQRMVLTLVLRDYMDKKTGGMSVLRDLLAGLQDWGMVFTLAALRAQKNGRRPHNQW